MENSVPSFAQFVRPIGIKHAPASAIEAALVAIGRKAEVSLSELPAERKEALINHFVRSIRNIGVHTASQLEHELLLASGCCPIGRRVVALKDAISLIAIRNQVQQVATATGLGWKESMRLQSAVSEVARFVTDRGGGRIELEATIDGIVVTVHATQDLGPIEAMGGPSSSWLAGTMNLVKDFRSSRASGAWLLELCFFRPQTMVA